MHLCDQIVEIFLSISRCSAPERLVPPKAVRNIDSYIVIVRIIELQRTDIFFHEMVCIVFQQTLLKKHQTLALRPVLSAVEASRCNPQQTHALSLSK